MDQLRCKTMVRMMMMVSNSSFIMMIITVRYLVPVNVLK